MNHFFWLRPIGLSALALVIAGCIESGEDSQPRPIPVVTVDAGTGPQTGAVKQSGSYTLRPTDTLSAEMFMDTNIRIQQVRVSSTGEIVMPLINNVKIGGLTLHQAQEKVNERYREFYKNPNVILTIVQYAERRVYVSGFVIKAGPILIPPEEEMTLSRAISAAGGLQARASRKDVTIKRTFEGRNEVHAIDMADIDSGKRPDFPLMEGDDIYVKDSFY